MASDGKVTISTALDNAGLEKGIHSISGSLGGLKGVVSKLGAAIGVAFSVAAVVNFGKEASKAAMQLSDALTGLQSILEGQGRSFSNAKAFIEEYTEDGLIPATNAITAYKNLAMRGYDDSQIRQVMTALKDASAYGRQASYTMGEAVESASEGLKNENSILVDNAGVTKNVAKMWEEYAASIGTTAANLTQQQKIQAEVTGILEESKYQTGDAAKVAGTLSGQLQQLSFNFNNLKIAVGNAVNPILQSLLPAINSAITTITRFANTFAAAMSLIFGQVSAQTEAVVESAEKATAAETDFAKSIGGAGKAAKKSLAGFDELNVLQSNAAGGGAGGGGGGGGSSSDTSVSGVAEIGEGVISKEAKKIAEIIKTIADYVPVIVTALAGLKLGAFISDLLTANIEAKTLKETIGLLAKKAGITLGVTLTLAGGALETKGIVSAIQEGLSGINFAEIILGGAGLAGGLSMVLKAILPSVTIAGQAVGGALLGGAIGGIIAGIPAFITGIYDAIVSGIDWLNAALVGAGATAAGAGIGAIVGMLGGPIGAGIGALIGLAVGLATVITKEIENGVEANVPNILLQSAEDLFAYLVFRDEDGTETRKAVRITVLSRPKPESYVYTETEVLNYTYLDNRLKDLEGEGLANAVADYLKENPVEAGATKEEAAQIQQNKADIETLNREKLDASKLPAAVEDALSQAKASGEFKGDPGDDYVLTEADKQEIAELTAPLVDVPSGGGSGGSAEWELLNTIILEEDSNSVIIDKDSNGNSFDLSAFMFYIDRVASDLQTANGTIYVGNARSGYFGQMQGVPQNQTRIWMSGEFMTKHMWRGSSGVNAGGTFSSVISYAGGNPTSAPMIRLYGYYFGAGTKITLYGVRK